MANGLRAAGLALLMGAAPAAQAAFHMFRIQQVYTNADGSVQYVVLRECCNAIER